jgi:hypothetical protein
MRLSPLLSGRPDSPHHVIVADAAAEIARKSFLDFFLCGIRIPVEKGF